MKTTPQTIQIFLPDGEPRGLRIAEITTRIVQAVQVPRTKLDRLFARQEAAQIGLYFLFGQITEYGKPTVYIGQTEDLPNRLKKHNLQKDFWTSAIVVISKTQSFTQAHIRYLEWLSIKTCEVTGRFQLDNGNSGGKPFVPEPMEADVLDAFETAGTLLATLGFPIFEPPIGSAPSAVQDQVFFCKGPDAEGSGALVEDGFVVFKGALCRRELVPSAIGKLAWRDELLHSNVLTPVNERQLQLTEDYSISSPSYAAAMILGRSANGWTEWRRNDGRTLHDVYR